MIGSRAIALHISGHVATRPPRTRLDTYESQSPLRRQTRLTVPALSGKQWRTCIAILLDQGYGWSREKGELSQLWKTASKTASKRDERNGTERDDQRRLNRSIRVKLGRTERSGTEWDRAPMFRKQQAVGSNPTAGSHVSQELKRLFTRPRESRFIGCYRFDSNADSNPYKRQRSPDLPHTVVMSLLLQRAMPIQTRASPSKTPKKAEPIWPVTRGRYSATKKSKKKPAVAASHTIPAPRG